MSNKIEQTYPHSHKLEVRKERNGRLRCLVCPNLPLLDTFPMFLAHREGKRHQQALKEFKRKIQQNATNKRKHCTKKPITPTSQSNKLVQKTFVPISPISTTKQQKTLTEISNSYQTYHVTKYLNFLSIFN